MASKDYALLDIQDENDEINLQFQDFSTAEATNTDTKEQTVYFSNFPDSHADDSEEKLNLIADEDETEKATHSIWSLEYYQQYFNVNTKQVGDRVIWSMVPKPGVDYLESYIRPNPDLYGPFWISVTLVLTTAIIGNLVSYLDSHDNHWRYNFHKVTLAASSIFCYTFIVPIAVWGILLWKGSRATFSLFELICVYGYSLSIFIPVSILWIVPLPWLQWCLGIVASVVSGSVLMGTILSAVPHETQKFGVAAVVFIVHAALALSFMLYFFNSPSNGLQNVTDIQGQNVVGNLTIDSISAVNVKLPNAPSQMTKRNEADIEDKNIPALVPEIKKPSVKENINILTKTNSLAGVVDTISDKIDITKSMPDKISTDKKTDVVSVDLKNSSKLAHM